MSHRAGEQGWFPYLVAYDVADDGRRNALADFLADLGGTRAQRSVYWVRLDRAGLVRMRAGAARHHRRERRPGPLVPDVRELPRPRRSVR